MGQTTQQFGGNWTEDKLLRVSKYLQAYTIALKNQPFEKYYVDAFAGTGYRSLEKKNKPKSEEVNLEFPEFTEVETIKFLEGSARKALQVEPRFEKFYFVEKSRKYSEELEKVKEDFPELAPDITIVRSDANRFLTKFCNGFTRWNQRAVIFLDPYGMQIPWTTIELIAHTEKIDLWYLFPLGMGVNRLLKKDPTRIDPAEKQKLDEIFGASDWIEAFYQPLSEGGLFGPDTSYIAKSSFFEIKRYFVSRLKSIFPSVANNPLLLTNSKNSPLYLLCFAASNKRGAKLALEIAEYILDNKI